MRTQALSRSALVENNLIAKKSANDKSEVSRKEVENPIKDNIEVKAEEVLIENGLGESRVKAPNLSPSYLMLKPFVLLSRATSVVNDRPNGV